MEVLQTLDDLSNVETGPRLLKPGIVLIHQVNVIPSKARGQRSSNTIQVKSTHFSSWHAEIQDIVSGDFPTSSYKTQTISLEAKQIIRRYLRSPPFMMVMTRQSSSFVWKA